MKYSTGRGVSSFFIGASLTIMASDLPTWANYIGSLFATVAVISYVHAVIDDRVKRDALK